MRFLNLVCGCALAASGCATSPVTPETHTSIVGLPAKPLASIEVPRLVLWLTVDQLRGDTWQRYGAQFGKGGFSRLLKSGLVYSNAHYGHAITETAPGHATLFTGASPREHGIIGNSWIMSDGRVTTSVSDDSSPLTGPGVSLDASPELIAAQGRSPLRLLVPTLGDEMTRASRGRAKIFAVSAKDRSAILPAGFSGHAFWLGPHGFVSSSYYGEPPAWLGKHHQTYPPSAYLKNQWGLSRNEADYRNASAGSPHAEKRMGTEFPHVIPDSLDPVKALTLSPFGDEAVLDLAQTIVDNEQLGSDDIVDLLSISLSSTDQIGHSYGPESREMEDQLMRLDARLSEFFSELDKRIGWDKVLVVLSADHGGCESAHFLNEVGLPGHRLTESEIAKETRKILVEEYGHDRFFLGVESPYVFLNQEKMQQAGRPARDVRRVVANSLQGFSGVHSAFARDDVLHSTETDPAEPRLLSDKVARAIHHQRSGDVYLVPRPYTLFLQDDDLAATHGSPWSYDTHVPVVMAGAGILSQSVGRAIDVRSLAPTVAKVIGVEAPPAADQPVLLEAFERTDGMAIP